MPYNERIKIKIKGGDEMENNFVKAYKIFAGGSAMYTTYRLLEKKTEELVLDGDESILAAFIIGAGQMAISMAVGVAVAATLTKKF